MEQEALLSISASPWVARLLPSTPLGASMGPPAQCLPLCSRDISQSTEPLLSPPPAHSQTSFPFLLFTAPLLEAAERLRIPNVTYLVPARRHSHSALIAQENCPKTGEMVQQGKCLPCKCENTRSEPQNPRKVEHVSVTLIPALLFL